jgi:preprotein translocase subunit SecY
LIILAGVIGEIAKGFTLMQSGEMNLWSACLFYGLIMVACMVILVYLARGKREVPIVQTGKRSRLFSARHSALPLQVNLSPDGFAGVNLLVGLSFIYLPVLTCIQTPRVQQFADGAASILGRKIHLFGPIAFTMVVFFTFILTENQFMASCYVPGLRAAEARIHGVSSRHNEHYYLRRIPRSITIPNVRGLAVVSVVPWAFLYFTNSTVSLLDATRWVITVGVINSIYWYVQDELNFANYEKKSLVR